MLALLSQNLKHILRTRLLFFLFIFSFVIQYFGVRILHSATIQFQGVISTIDAKDSLFLALVFQIFTGAFLSAVYGIWMVPYAHQGLRSQLTFTLPVSKWAFPLAYAISMLGLLIFQHLILFTCYGMNFGFGFFLAPNFPWAGLFNCLVVETVAFEMCLFAFAVSSMSLGQVPTFFLSSTVLFVLQLTGGILRLNLGSIGMNKSSALEMIRSIYNWLPPVGELVYDLRNGYLRPDWASRSLALWAIWLAAFVLLFRYKLRYPLKTKIGET